MEGQGKSKTFEEVVAWQKAHEFVLAVYDITKTFPKEELFALTSQLRRAAISIPANIAEGYKKYGEKDKIRFFNIAQGSLEECRYYLFLARDIKYIGDEDYNKLNELISKTSFLLNSYSKSIREAYNNKKSKI